MLLETALTRYDLFILPVCTRFFISKMGMILSEAWVEWVRGIVFIKRQVKAWQGGLLGPECPCPLS